MENVIISCKKCENRGYIDSAWYCKKKSLGQGIFKQIEDINILPKWCPLLNNGDEKIEDEINKSQMSQDDDYEDDEKMLCEAMFKAKEAFEQYFMNIGVDAAYYELELSGFTLDVDFERMNQIIMKKVE